jgi:hypothetical protein
LAVAELAALGRALDGFVACDAARAVRLAAAALRQAGRRSTCAAKMALRATALINFNFPHAVRCDLDGDARAIVPAGLGTSKRRTTFQHRGWRSSWASTNLGRNRGQLGLTAIDYRPRWSLRRRV